MANAAALNLPAIIPVDCAAAAAAAVDTGCCDYTNAVYSCCCVFMGTVQKNVLTLNSGSEITQGHYHSINYVWFPISVLQLYFVHKTQRFWDIRLQKCCDGENRVRGPSMLLPFLSPFDRAYTTSYWRSVVTMALSRDVYEIFNVEKCRDLEIRVRGHSRSSKVVPFDRLCMVSY